MPTYVCLNCNKEFINSIPSCKKCKCNIVETSEEEDLKYYHDEVLWGEDVEDVCRRYKDDFDF